MHFHELLDHALIEAARAAADGTNQATRSHGSNRREQIFRVVSRLTHLARKDGVSGRDERTGRARARDERLGRVRVREDCTMGNMR